MGKRFKGIDILRIIAMLFVVELHLLSHGGVLEAVSKGTVQYAIAYLYETISYCGVAIFGIITGFVSYSKPHKKNRGCRFFSLWIEVVFYSLLLTVSISLTTIRSVDVRAILDCFFPIARQTYWYFTTYFILFLIMPFLNRIIFENTAFQNTAFLCFAIVMLYYSHTLTGLFAISMLTLCYLIGALIRKYNIQCAINNRKCVVCYFTLMIITYLWTVLIKPLNSAIGGILMRYDSPAIIGMAFCIVVFFAQIETLPKPFNGLSTLGKYAFAIYLINDNPLFRKYFIENKFAPLSNSTVCLIVSIPVIAVIFSLICVLIDMLRTKLFGWLHVSSIQDKIFELWNRLTQVTYKCLLLLILKKDS